MEWAFPSFSIKCVQCSWRRAQGLFYTENNLIWSLYILEEGPGLNWRAADWRLHDGCSFNRTSTTAKAEKKRALFTALQLAALLLYIVLESLNYGRWMPRICMVLCSKAFIVKHKGVPILILKNNFSYWSTTCSRRLYISHCKDGSIAALKYHSISILYSAFQNLEKISIT